MSHQHTALCDELRPALPDYLDGVAQDEICRAIEAHLSNCPDCKIHVDTLKKTIVLYRTAPPEVVSGEVHQRLVRVLNLDTLRDQ